MSYTKSKVVEIYLDYFSIKKGILDKMPPPLPN